MSNEEYYCDECGLHHPKCPGAMAATPSVRDSAAAAPPRNHDQKFVASHVDESVCLMCSKTEGQHFGMGGFCTPAAAEGETPEFKKAWGIFEAIEKAMSEPDGFPLGATTIPDYLFMAVCRRLRAGGRDEREAPVAWRWEDFEGIGGCPLTHYDEVCPQGTGPKNLTPLYARPVAPAVNEKVREALEFYADRARYEYDSDCCFEPPKSNKDMTGILEDDGEFAREALALLAPSTTNPEQK